MAKGRRVIFSRGTEGERSISSSSAETLFLRLLLSALSLGASVLISRGLGPEGRGAYYLPIVAAATIAAFSTLGLEQANVYLLGTRKISLEHLSGQNGLVAVCMGGVGLALLLVAPFLLPSMFADTPMVLLLLTGLTIPFALHAQFSAGLLNLRGQVTWQFRAALLAGLVQVATLLGLFLSSWFDVSTVLAVNLATVVFTWAVTVSARGGGNRAWIRWDARLLRNTMGQSLLLHLGMALFFLHLRLDMFMIKGMVGTTALGLYSLSVILAETVLLATDSLALVILPRQMVNTLPEAASLALRGARTNALLGIGLAVLWAAGGIVVIRILFGPAFLPAYAPLVSLLPGMVFLGMQRVCGGPVLRTGRPGRIAAIYAVSLPCNGALNLWWIPMWGPLGAALASSVSYGLGAMLFLAWTARLAEVPLAQGIFPRKSDWLLLRQAALQGSRLLQQTTSTGKQVQ
jgi:O-antigen/teichoic acid export membrane protein